MIATLETCLKRDSLWAKESSFVQHDEAEGEATHGAARDSNLNTMSAAEQDVARMGKTWVKKTAEVYAATKHGVVNATGIAVQRITDAKGVVADKIGSLFSR